MSLVINANGKDSVEFNNDFLLYYRDYRCYLFLPDRSIQIQSGQGPSNLTQAFSQNGTPVNTLCQRLTANSLSSTAVNFTGNSLPHNFGGIGETYSCSNEDMGTVRLGDVNQFIGGEVLSEVRRQGSVSFAFSNQQNSKIQNPNFKITFKPGLLHTDGTITYLGELVLNRQESGSFNGKTIWDGNGIQKLTFPETITQEGDRFIMEIHGYMNSATYYSGYNPTTYHTSWTVDFPDTAPFLQRFL